MKFAPLPFTLAATALLIHSGCKPKPVASVATPTPEAAAAATPAADSAPAAVASAPQPTLPPPPPQANAGGNRPGGGGGGGAGNFQQRADERMQRMKTELGLTDDQATKIRAVYEQNFGPLRQQMGDSSVSREDRRAAFEKARAAATAQVEAILTPEQKPKWEAFQKEAEQRRGQRRQGGNGGNN